jgi:ribonuclease E
MPADDVAEEVGETVAIDRGEAHQEGERRRRRRGRRGGRRNRMDREREGTPGSYDNDAHEQEHAVTTAEALTAPPAMEADLREAVADLDAAPASAPPAAEPADLAAAQASPPPAQPEPSRRRSTVREPAPSTSSTEASQEAPVVQPASPVPEPVVTEVGDSETTERPRRSGWWSRRIAGG